MRHPAKLSNILVNTNVDTQVPISSNTVLNILSNYISHKSKICDDHDLPWMTTKIKEIISQENKLYYCIKK